MILGACSFQTIKNIIAPQAQGVILYDEEAELVEKDLQQYDGKLEFSKTLPFKMIESGGQKTMILSDTSANVLLDKGLWHEILSDDEVKSIDSLKSVSEQPLLFTKNTAAKQVFVNDKAMDVTNGGNIVIGQTRKYTEQFLIVSDKQWDQVEANEHTMGILHFSNELNPKNELQNFNTSAFQMVMIK